MNPSDYLPPPAAANSIPGDPLAHGADPTEAVRRLMLALDQPAADLEAEEGPVWDTPGAVGLFEFISFAAPFVLVRRRVDGVEGTLEFTHNPRRYFNFIPRES
jgi:hypothetical protein